VFQHRNPSDENAGKTYKVFPAFKEGIKKGKDKKLKY
jgi:hypothetical protein